MRLSDIPYDEPEGAVMHLEDVRRELDEIDRGGSRILYYLHEDQARALVWIIDHTAGCDADEDLVQYLRIRAPYIDAKRAARG
jgi:hypothetical protein